MITYLEDPVGSGKFPRYGLEPAWRRHRRFLPRGEQGQVAYDREIRRLDSKDASGMRFKCGFPGAMGSVRGVSDGLVSSL